MKNDFIKSINSLNLEKLLKSSGDELEILFGKEFSEMKNFNQNNPHHHLSLLEHTIRVVEVIQCEGLTEKEMLELKIAAFYHDVGKPLVAFEKNGRTVFYNHSTKSREIAEQELAKHNLGHCSLGRILFYIEHHDDFISFKLKTDIKDSNPYIFPISLESVYRKILATQEANAKIGGYIPTFYDYSLLMRLCIADAKAQSLKVLQDGKVIDSLNDKLARLNTIAAHIMVIKQAEFERCDLHTHSICSDGTDTPSEIVSMAFESGLRAVALTDHNTVDGLDEFLRAAREYEIDAIPGIEFSTEFEKHELHVVGLFIKKSTYRRINRFLSSAKEAKEKSNKNLIENLRNDGYDVSYSELEAYATNKNINRAVIGQYLLSKGIISSVKEGFKTILSKNYGYYIPSQRPSTLDTIKFIKSIGAVAVLAHPLLDLSQEELELFLPLVKEAGVDAIESHYSLFTDEQRKWLTKIAIDNNLLESGGSDYHGLGKPHISLGAGEGDLSVPISLYLQLLKKFQP